MEREERSSLSEVTKRVTPSITAPGDANLSDATADQRVSNKATVSPTLFIRLKS